MSNVWADEITGSEPDPKLETFYLLVAMKLGDPRRKDWIIENAEEFYAMYQDWARHPHKHDNSTVMIQYLLWYERDGPPEQVDTTSTRGT